MDTPSSYTRNMYQQYQKQMLTSRVMAYRQYTRKMASGEEPEITPEVKRGMMVNRVAREIFTNLLVIGSNTPLVNEVREKLRETFGEELQFCYPPGSLEVVIYRKTADGKTVPLNKNEQIDATNRAWHIILKTVDTYMI